mgnify:CR=1 FL=1
MLDIALGNVSALDDVLRDMGNGLRSQSSIAHDMLQWDHKLPPEVPTDWVQCDRCKKWRRLPWHVRSLQYKLFASILLIVCTPASLD